MATYSYFVKPQAFYVDVASVTPAQPMVFDYADIPVFRFGFLPNAIQAGDTLVFASDDDMIFYSDDPGNILHSASCMIINKHVVTEEEAAALKVEMPINTRTIKFRDTVNGKIRPVDVMTALYVLRDTGDDKAYSVLAKGRGLCNAIIADYDSLPEPITTGEYYTKDELDALLAEKAEASALQAHVDDADIHVTLDDKSKWDSKADIQDITDAVDGLAPVAKTGSYNDLTDQPVLATVATTGSYNDLTDQPTIPGTPEIQAPVDAHNAAPDAHAQLFEAKQDKITAEAPLPVANVSGLATVATTGSYNDLSDQPAIPTVPTKVSEFDNDANYQTGEQVDKAVAPLATTESVNAGLATKQDKIDDANKLPAGSVEGLATVATTGSYNDLSDQPTIPAAANDAKITITQGGVEKGSFTLNQLDPKTIEVDAGGGAADEVNYLTFTAEEAGSTLHLDKRGDATLLTARLQYRLNGGDWIDYGWTELAGDPITLTNVGDKVQFKATDQNEQFSVRINASYRFIMTGRIAGSGSIMTLLDETDQLRDLTGKEHCFVSLFAGCTSLTEAPELPATTLAQSCYENLFRGAGLIKAPELPATTLAQSCYKALLYGCTSLTKAPALPATTLTPGCYANLFAFCSNLTTAPELPATTLTLGCYANLFESCYNLTKAPALPATTLAQSCYEKLFADCYHLTTAPELPAITLAESCYSFLFQGCSRLNEAPKLPATTLAKKCYQYLFQNCTALEKINIAYSGADNPDSFRAWTSGVSPTGTIVCPEGFPSEEVPAGWTRVTSYDDVALDAELQSKADKAELNAKQDKIDDVNKLPAGSVEGLATVATTGSYNDLVDQPVIPAAANDAKITITQGGIEKGSFTLNQADPATIEVDAGGAVDEVNYLTFTAEQAGSKLHLDKVGDVTQLTARLQYRLNGGDWVDYNWTELAGDPITLTNIGDNVQFKATDQNEQFSNSDSNYYQFAMTGKIAGSGSIMTLLDKTDQLRDLTGKNYCFCNLFQRCEGMVDAPELPSTKLAPYCYFGVFDSCISLKSAPELPATTMMTACYAYAFRDCLNLQISPSLPATELASECYCSMLSGTNLYQAPELPATTLAPYCYKEMLTYCSSLRTVPSLPATELAEGCYLAMFQSCDSLTKINIGYSGPSNSQAFDYWIGDTMMGGTIVCPEGFPAEHIPMGWTRVTSYDDEALDAELQSKADKSELPVNPVVGSAAGMKLWTGLQSEYDGIQTKDPSTVYVIKEG